MTYVNFKGGLYALLFLLLYSSNIFANTIVINEDIILDKTVVKLDEMGAEVLAKTGVSIVVIAQKHMDQKMFMEYKTKYAHDLKKHYIVWLYSRTYADKNNIGVNQMFVSDDLKGKFDQGKLFSPWSGAFTKVLTAHSKTDTTSAAYLNGFESILEQLSAAYEVTFDSSIGHEGQTFINIVRFIFYAILVAGGIYYIRIRRRNRERERLENAKKA